MNITYVSNFTTNLTCTLVDNVNTCTGQLAVVPYNQDISIVLQAITALCLIIITTYYLSRIVMK